ELLHPIMPFMTEELWEKTAEAGPPRDSMLISARWPDLPASYADGAAAPEIAEGASFALPVAEFIDLAAERARLTKEVARLATDIDRTAKKLANPDFVARAPEEVVDENRERLAEAEAARERLGAALKRLESMA